MKKLVAIAMLMMTGCGFSSVDNELIAQPKKVFHQTPIICPNRNDVDVLLGVMRGGVGSMSTQDVMLTVSSEKHVKILEQAIADGKLVKIHYNQYRFVWCQQEDDLIDVEIVDGVVKSEDEKREEEIKQAEEHLKALRGKQ